MDQIRIFARPILASGTYVCLHHSCFIPAENIWMFSCKTCLDASTPGFIWGFPLKTVAWRGCELILSKWGELQNRANLFNWIVATTVSSVWSADEGFITINTVIGMQRAMNNHADFGNVRNQSQLTLRECAFCGLRCHRTTRCRCGLRFCGPFSFSDSLTAGLCSTCSSNTYCAVSYNKTIKTFFLC